MKKIFTTTILSAMIFMLNFGTAKAVERVQVCDFGLYTMINKLAESGLTLTPFIVDGTSWVTPPDNDGLSEYFYRFNDAILVIDFGVNGDGYVSDILIFSSSDNTNIEDYGKVIYHICKVLGMNDDMAEYMFHYRRATTSSGNPPGVEINNRAIILYEESVNNSPIGDLLTTFYAVSLK